MRLMFVSLVLLREWDRKKKKKKKKRGKKSIHLALLKIKRKEVISMISSKTTILETFFPSFFFLLRGRSFKSDFQLIAERKNIVGSWILLFSYRFLTDTEKRFFVSFFFFKGESIRSVSSFRACLLFNYK